MAKHGIEQHFVRPDRVYATGVLTPTVGYQPVADAQQVAARFVSGGQGLAGPQLQLLGPRMRRFNPFRGVGLAGARLDGIIAWLRGLFANLTIKIKGWRIRRELTVGPGTTTEKKADGSTVTSVDTSPRPPEPYAGAIPTESGWSPAPQSPTTAANVVSNGFATNPGAPMLPSIAASMELIPAAISAPAMFWQQRIAPSFPPTVAVRAGAAALKNFYKNLAGGGRR